MYMSLNRAIAGLAISLLCTLSAASAVSAEAEPAQWKSTAKVSYVRTSGNSDTETLAGELESSFEPEPNRYFLKASVLFAEQNGVESSSRWFLEGRYERTITGRFFGWAI